MNKEKNSKLAIGAAALVAVIATAGFVAVSFAYQGDPSVQGMNYSPERHEAMTAAFDSADYSAWLEAKGNVGNGRMMEVVNEENFDKFVEMRNLRLAGDSEGADAIRAELGLGQCGRMKGQNQSGVSNCRGAGKEASGAGARGQNRGGGFVDTDNNGVCDLME